jgi:hypothetical protein
VSSLTKLKLALTIIGLVLFGYGVRVDEGTIRLVGIGFVAAASLLRFVKRRAAASEPTPPDRDGPVA